MSDLDRALERIGRIVAADQGLTVRVRGAQAYATPGVVTLPSLDNYEALGPNAERMLHGLLDHECGHAAHSDFGVLEQAAKKSDALRTLLNAIEDAYVEGRQGLRYVGCADNLKAKNDWFWQKPIVKDQSAADYIREAKDPWSAFMLALSVVARPYGGPKLEDIEAVNPEIYEMLKLVEHELDAIEKLFTQPKASAQCLKIAERIYKVFNKPAPPKPKDAEGKEGKGGDPDEKEEKPSKEKSSSEGAGKGDESKGEEGEDAEGEGGEGEGEESEGDDKSEGGDKEGKSRAGGGDSRDEGKSSKRGEKSADDAEGSGKAKRRQFELKRWQHELGMPLNPEEAINSEIVKMFEQPEGVPPYAVFSHEWDVEKDLSTDTFSEDETNRFDALVHDVSEATDALIQAFEVGLRSKREQRLSAGYDEGEVDIPSLLEYSAGASSPDRIFAQRIAEDDRSVAVAVLVDCSGSMDNSRGSKSELAAQTAVAIQRALSAVQVPHEISGFTTLISQEHTHPWVKKGEWAVHQRERFAPMEAAYKEAKARGTDLSIFGRGGHSHEIMEVPFHAVFKSFESTDARGLINVAGIANNLDGEAVLWQARRLARRPEQRRVMFVLSDGMPSAYQCDNAVGAKHLEDSVKQIIEAGIEVYGIGIMSRAVTKFYPQHWVCHSIGDLPSLAVDAVTSTLLQNRQEHACVRL